MMVCSCIEICALCNIVISYHFISQDYLQHVEDYEKEIHALTLSRFPPQPASAEPLDVQPIEEAQIDVALAVITPEPVAPEPVAPEPVAPEPVAPKSVAPTLKKRANTVRSSTNPNPKRTKVVEAKPFPKSPAQKIFAAAAAAAVAARNRENKSATDNISNKSAFLKSLSETCFYDMSISEISESDSDTPAPYDDPAKRRPTSTMHSANVKF